jgi:hypothetical protein
MTYQETGQEVVCHVCGYSVCFLCGGCQNPSCENCSCPEVVSEDAQP